MIAFESAVLAALEETRNALTAFALEQDRLRLLRESAASAARAGNCFVRYRRRRGGRRSPLPDFCIGAHAAVVGLVLLTRDATRHRTYFPGLEIIAQ